MKPAKHVIASGFFATAFYLFVRSFWPSILCFISGFLADLDHYLDFYLNTKRAFARLEEIYFYCEELKYKKSYLLLHSFDLIILFWILIAIFNLNIYYVAVAVGVTQHLVFDQLMNKNEIKSFSYFIIFRLMSKFNTKLLFKKD